jgi:hypothetical protein
VVTIVTRTASRRICACSLVAILLIAGLGACGGSSVNQASGHAQPPASPTKAPSSVSEPQSVPVVARVEPDQRADFALLRTPPEGLPNAIRHVLGVPVFGSSWNLAQRIPTQASGAYWLLPGDGYMCMVSDDSMGSRSTSTVCARASQARRHGIAAIAVTRRVPGSHVAAGRLIVGLAPDGAHQVVVHTRGSTETAPVRGTVFVLHDTTPAPPDFFTPR